MKKRRIRGLTLVIAGAMLLGGCSGQASQEEIVEVLEETNVAKTDSVQAEPIIEQEVTKPLAEIYAEIQKGVELYSPMEFDDEFLMNYYGIDASLLEEYVFSMSEDAASAETIVVMKAKSSSDVESLSASLQVVVDEKRNEMENYLPEQFAIVEKAEVETKDNYIWLVISENEDTIKKIIEDGLK
ncbi:MAG: DUF4358 domain-containing protein [Lachnospiraceae bacterium]|nr:DUF4358 domain-containing protein [Lachnospiraceae bacterium]